MKKIIILALLSFNTCAQFLASEPPTEIEVKLNSSNNISEVLKLAAIARGKKDYQGFEQAMVKAVRLKPHVPILTYQLAQAYALNNSKTKAFDTLIGIQKQGIYFDLSIDPSFDNIKSYPVFNYIKENIDVNGEHHGSGKQSFNINKSFSGLLFESLAFDANSQSFLMGSIRDGRVIKIAAKDGEISTLIAPAKGGLEGPWSSIDLAIDEKNDILWLASSAISQFGNISKESTGLSAIFKYQLSNGKLLKSFKIPGKKGPSLFSAIHLTNKGDLFIIDTLNKAVLKIAKGEKEIALAFSTPKYNSLRSITSDETGEILYLSDSDQGIIIVSLQTQKFITIENSATLSLLGITDLIYDDNGLIFIQNGFQPERIMRIELQADKATVKNVFAMESAHPLFKSPSYGVVIGEGLYYIANSQIPKTNRMGGLLPGQQWQDMYVLSSAKHYQEQSSLDYKKQIKSYKKNSGAN
jgi:hypothetical protein